MGWEVRCVYEGEGGERRSEQRGRCSIFVFKVVFSWFCGGHYVGKLEVTAGRRALFRVGGFLFCGLLLDLDEGIRVFFLFRLVMSFVELNYMFV